MKTFVLMVLAAAVWVFVIYSTANTSPGANGEGTGDPEKDQVIRDAIANHRLIIGMSRPQVVASWGEPSSALKTGTSEQLEYFDGNHAYLDDGVLSSFSQITMPSIMKREIRAAVAASPTPARYPGGLQGTDLDQKSRR